MAEDQVQSIVKTKLSLLDAVKKLGTIKFDFEVVGKETTQPDKEGKTKDVIILKLFTPIPYVRGTNKIPMPDGTFRNLEANDVTEIKVLDDNAKSESFDMVVTDDEITGTYEGSDLMLDISKSQGDVWLTKESFASLGNSMRNNMRNDRLAKLQARASTPARIQ